MSPAQPAVSRSSMVTLRESTEPTLWDLLKLNVSTAQTRFVASNAISIAQAHLAARA